MNSDFNSRFTHALLIAVIVVLTGGHDHNAGEPWRMLYVLWLISACFLWAWGLPKLHAWSERKSKSAQ